MFSRLCFVASWSNGLWRQEREVPVERVLESTIVQVVLPGHRPCIRTRSLVSVHWFPVRVVTIFPGHRK
jgi:hypothetical protein